MRIPLVVFCAGVLALSCSSQKQVSDPGPAQRAGARVDQGAEQAKESAEEAGQKVGNATEKASDKLDENSRD
jgi:hypothetical protein